MTFTFRALLLPVAVAFFGVTAIASASGPAAAASDSCYARAADGTCLDDYAIPVTGQYRAADGHAGETPVGVDRANQPHGVVRLRESTFVDAHDICRFVDNDTARGPGLFIGLRTRAEWAGFAIDGKQPVGTTVIRCCRPVAVEICGASRSMGYTKQGDATTFTGGHNRVVTYTCAAGTSGAAPTFDTSWLVAQAGQCAAPTPADTGCKQSKGGTKRGECTGNSDGDGGHDNDRGSGSNGPGKGNDGTGGNGGHQGGGGNP